MTTMESSGNVAPEYTTVPRDERDTSKNAEVVFSTPSSYSALTWLLLAFAPVVLITQATMIYTDDKASNEEKWQEIKGIFWGFLSITVVYMLVIPKRFEVVSDASINVITILNKTWNFKNVTAAYDNIGIFQELARPKIKFAMDWNHRVVVRRKGGAWDVLVSPQDSTEFIDAVWKVAEQVEGDQK